MKARFCIIQLFIWDMFNHRDHEQLGRGKKASPTLLPSAVSRVINAVFGSERRREKGRVDPINVPYILVFLSSPPL